MITEENDALIRSGDRHYTQGIRASWMPGILAPEDKWNAPFQWVADSTSLFSVDGAYKRQYEWTVVGQSIFTPRKIDTSDPNPADRPYGAWLYTGVSLLQQDRTETHDTLENAEFLIGVVGPLAFGKLVQNDWHQLIGIASAQGWKNQLHNEPGAAFSYERKWRFGTPLGDYLSIDAIPEAGVTLGNIYTYGEAGGFLRFGHGLQADYGPSHIRPSLSGTAWYDSEALEGLGWYVFVGAQGRAVGRNIFLDGNTWRDSPSVDKKPFVADLLAGISIFWSESVRLDLTAVERTKEYYGHKGHKDRFGSLGLAVRF